MQQILFLNRLVLACTVLVIASNAAQATPVLYTFNAGTMFNNITLSYTAPDFITTDSNVLAANLDSCSTGFGPVPTAASRCDSVGFIPSDPSDDRIDVFRRLLISPDTVITTSYRFPNGSLDAVGSYEDIEFRIAHLDVTLVNTGVPEPGSLALLVMGAVGLLGWNLRTAGAT